MSEIILGGVKLSDIRAAHQAMKKDAMSFVADNIKAGRELFEELMERDGGGLGSSYGPFSGDDDKAELLRTAREALTSEGETDGNG